MPLLQTVSDKLLDIPVTRPAFNSLTHRLFEYFFVEQDLTFLDDQVVCIHCSTLNLSVCYTRIQEKIELVPARRWDVKISISLGAMLSLLADDADADTLFFNRELKLEGDTTLGLLCKNMLDSMNRDQLPDHLSGLLKWMNEKRQLIASSTAGY